MHDKLITAKTIKHYLVVNSYSLISNNMKINVLLILMLLNDTHVEYVINKSSIDDEVFRL